MDAHFHLSLCSLPTDGTLPPGLDTATIPDQWAEIAERSQNHLRVIPFFGIHPWWADQWNEESKNSLTKLLQDNPQAGVGEIGLDRKKGVDFSLQRNVFQEQLAIAADFKRPLNLHNVKAWGPMEECLKPVAPLPFILHGYSGSAEMTEVFIKLGGYISFAPFSLKHKKGREALKAVPQERLLLDTDFPYRMNQPLGEYPGIYQGLYEEAGKIIGINQVDLELLVQKNIETYLNKKPPPDLH